MEIILSLFLLVSIVIMFTLIYIGYFLYNNSKKNAQLKLVILQKEKDLLELYESLEYIIKETESCYDKCNEKIKLNLEEMKNINNGILNKNVKENVVEDELLDIDNPDFETNKTEKEKMTKHYEENDKIASKVKAFHKMGATVSEIAKSMGIGKGEVELRLNLKNKENNLLF